MVRTRFCVHQWDSNQIAGVNCGERVLYDNHDNARAYEATDTTNESATSLVNGTFIRVYRRSALLNQFGTYIAHLLYLYNADDSCSHDFAQVCAMHYNSVCRFYQFLSPHLRENARLFIVSRDRRNTSVD